MDKMKVFLDLQRSVQRFGHALTDAEGNIRMLNLHAENMRAQQALAEQALTELAKVLEV